MNHSERIRRIQLQEIIESECTAATKEKIDRYLEIEYQGIINNHYFAKASSECIYLYRDGYFIAAVMMSHAINEGIVKYITERNNLDRQKEDSNTKSIEELLVQLEDKNIISEICRDASIKIWKSFRADIHHMNPKVAKINFRQLAQQNLKNLSVIERELFSHDVKDGAIMPHQPKYWEINADGTAQVFLRLE